MKKSVFALLLALSIAAFGGRCLWAEGLKDTDNRPPDEVPQANALAEQGGGGKVFSNWGDEPTAPVIADGNPCASLLNIGIFRGTDGNAYICIDNVWKLVRTVNSVGTALAQ
jgi:hypothetical protein